VIFIRLSGAPDGSSIKVTAAEGVLEIAASHPVIFAGGRAEYTLVRSAADQRSLLLDETIMLNPGQPPGLGLRLFAIQAHTAADLGVGTIALEAAGSANSRTFNGYYTWPRYGFDAVLTEAERASVPQELGTVERVSDLMRTEAGRRWWRARGGPKQMEFDLTPGSRSWAFCWQ